MAPVKQTKAQLYCSFCGKANTEVKRIIAGPGTVAICDECVWLCLDIVMDDKDAPPRVLTPVEQAAVEICKTVRPHTLCVCAQPQAPAICPNMIAAAQKAIAVQAITETANEG